MNLRGKSEFRLLLTIVAAYFQFGCAGVPGKLLETDPPMPEIEPPVLASSEPAQAERPFPPTVDGSPASIEAPRLNYSYLFRYGDLVRNLYDNHREGYDQLGVQLELDNKYKKVYCNGDLMEGLQIGQKLENFLSNSEEAVYRPLCEFTTKVAAYKSGRGSQFLISGYEVEDRMVYVYLDRRNMAKDLYPKCSVSSYDSDRGYCDVVIDSKWSIGYRWEPFCKEYMKGELGC